MKKVMKISSFGLLLMSFLVSACTSEENKKLNKEEYLQWFQEHRNKELSDVFETNNITYRLQYLPKDLNKLSEHKHYNYQLQIKVTPGSEWYNKYPFSQQKWVELGLKNKNRNKFMLIDGNNEKHRPKDVYFEFNQVNTNLVTVNLFFDIEEKKENKWKIMFDENIFSKNVIEFELEVNELPQLII